MYPVPEALKTIYKNDFIPAVPVNYDKYLILYFPELDLTIDTRTTGRIDGDSFSLDENLCSANDLTLGACEASILKIKINGIVQDLTGKKCIVTQYVDNEYEMPFGEFTIKTAGKQSDLGFKELTMFDSMVKSDIDVSGWYNALTWPQTVKSMRQSLLTYLGLQYEDQTITNDTVQIQETINPSSLSGRDVLKRLCEINAGFGHFTRNGKFKVIQLSGVGLYPSETLYPAEDLFPSESGEYISAGYESADYEEYIVESITSVTIREDDEDVGATSGTTGNPYIITGNFLLYGKTAIELQIITDNILLQVKNKFYRPHTTKMIGLPYMEVGDSVTIITSTDAIESFIFKRSLTGINSLKDSISASGNQVRDQKVSPSTEIQQLKGKTLRIQKSVDELRIDMSDADAQLATQISVTAGGLQTQITDNYNSLSNSITLTAGQLQTQITDNKNDLQGQITLTAGQLQTQITDNKDDANSSFTQQAAAIALRVEKAGVIAAINLSPESVKIQATNIELEGIVTANNNFKILLDGSMEAVNGDFSGDIHGSSIIGSLFTQVNSSNTQVARIQNGIFYGTQVVTTDYNSAIGGITGITYGVLRPGYLSVGTGTGLSFTTTIDYDEITTGTILCTRINGGTPITGSNQNSFYYNSNRIEPITTSGGNVGLHGLNVASVNWCNDTFELKSPSDFRLKRNFKPLSELPLSLFYEIKAMQFEFKTNDYGKGVYFGFFAQKIESAFTKHGFNALEYNIVQLRKVNKYNNEGFYIKDEVHVVNYNNFIAWEWDILQKICEKIDLKD